MEPSSCNSRGSDSRGLAIVESVSRSWGISRTRLGKVVWAELDYERTVGSLRGSPNRLA
jgi:hypothetical protein